MSQPYFTGYSTGASSTEWLIPILDRQRYESQFKTQPLDTSGRLSGQNARGLLHRSGLPTPVLSQIWSLVDRDCDGFINMAEFCAAQHLVKKACEGVPLPATLPVMLLEAQSLTPSWNSPGYATQSLPRNFSTAGYAHADSLSLPLQESLPTLKPTSAGGSAFGSLTSSLAAMQPLSPAFQSKHTPSSKGPGGVGLAVSLATVSEGWSMSASERRRYILVFNTLDRKKTGFIGGTEARNELLKSHLDYGLLAKIWELADVDKDGRLSTAEFCIAMHLSEKAKRGLSIPPNLPPELLKEAKAGNGISSSKSTENIMTLEDKRRANWEEGQRKLESIRQEIREKQEREKAAAEEKKRAIEEARLQKEREEAERKRELELERQRKIVMEQERERQRLLLQREAEERERERKQREEWTKQRCREMEVKCQVERGLVRRLQARRTDLEEDLSQLRSTKEKLGRELEHHRNLCQQYSDTIRHISLSLDLRKAERDELQMNLEGVRIELSSLQSEHTFYSSALQDSPETLGISLQQDHLVSIKVQLQSSLTSLRAQKIFLAETKEKTRQQQLEGAKDLKELNVKIQSEEKALEQLRHLFVMRKREFEEKQKVEQQRLAWIKKKQQENRKLEEAKRKEEEKKRLEALQQKLEEQRKKEALLQKEKWEALATAPAVTKRSFEAAKEVRTKTTPEIEKKEQRNQLEGPSIGRQDSWLIIDSPIVSRQRLSPPPPRPRPYKFSGGQDSSRKPRPRSEVFSVNDVVIQPIRMPLQKAPITQKRGRGDSGGSSSPNPDRGGDAIKSEPGQALSQSPAPSSAVLKEKVRDMQEKRLKRQQEERKRKEAENEEAMRAQQAEARKRLQEEEAKRFQEEEAARKQAQEEEARKQAQEEEARKQAQEEEARKQAQEEEARKQAQEEEARKQAQEEEARRQQVKDEGTRPGKLFRALYSYSAMREDELSVVDGDIVKEFTLSSPPPQYWMGVELNGKTGLVPESYFEELDGTAAGGPVDPPTVTLSEANDTGTAAMESNNIYAVPQKGKYMNMEEAGSVLKENNAPTAQASQHLTVDEGADVPQSEYMNFEAVEAALTDDDSRSMVGKVVKVLFSWSGLEDNQLQIKKDQIISIVEEKDDWCMGSVGGKSGWFPKSYVEVMGSTQRKKSGSPMPLSPVAERHEAIYDFEGQEEGDLVFSAGDIIEVISKEAGDWWKGRLGTKQGIFPANYVEPAVQKQLSTTSASSTQSADAVSVSSLSQGEANTKPVVAKVKKSYTAQGDGQLSLKPGQVIRVRQQRDDGWWEGELQSRGQKKQVGWFPSTHVELLPSSSRRRENPPVSRSISTASTVSGVSTASTAVQEQPPKGIGSVLALYSYTADNADELSFYKGSVITVLSKNADEGWWHGELDNKTGLFPSNYVQALDDQLPLPSSRWKECVSAHVLSYLTDIEVKRQEAIFELIVSEQSYTDSLKLVQEVFFGPMESAHVLRPDEMARVKVNWSELIECSEKFLSALMVRLRSSKMVVDNIGELLVAQIPNLKPHIRWCSCQLQACTILQNKTSNPFFREFEQKCAQDPRTGGLPLSSFLLKPMQRVTKYPLLMKRILDYTNELHPDKEDLRQALKLAEKLCKEVNEGVRSTENTEQMEWLQCHVQIVGIEEDLIFNSQTNFMGQRKLLHHGKLTKVRGNKPLLGFLFNDFLLLAKPSGFFEQNMEPFKSGHFLLYRTPFILDSLKPGRDTKSGPEAFSLTYQEDKELVLKAESEKARDEWIKRTWNAVIAFTQTKKQQKGSKEKDTLRPAVATLEVLVVGAADLKASDSNGKSDPFCVIRFANQEQATHHIPKTLNPKWNTKLVFAVRDPSTDTLEVTVFDRDMFSPNDFLGSASVSLQKLLLDGPGPWTKCLLLEDTPTGEITLKIKMVD